MGGIAGIFDRRGQPFWTGLVENMAGSLIHRARNREISLPNVTGHARLGQIGGKAAAGHTAALVLDGDIYNKVPLCDKYRLNRNIDDAALALAVWENDGMEGLASIDGDLALAIYENLSGRLILFRDRFGIKPLFYTRIGDEYLFASEVKAFRAHLGFQPAPNEEMLYDFLATHYRYIHRYPGHTYWYRVHQVKPAHCLTIHPTRKPEEYCYWRLEREEDLDKLSVSRKEERLKIHFRESVAARLSSDRSMGFSVSSGMDSSSVCSQAAALAGPQDLYSVSYGYSEYDESQGIAPVAERWGKNWRNIVLSDPPLFETVERLVRIHEGPLCTVTWLSHYFLVKQAAEDGREIVFSGLGGDECLAGEYEHFLYYFADLKQAGLETRLASELAAWQRLHDHPVFRKNRSVVEDVFTRLVDLNQPGRIFLDQKRYRAYHPYFEPDFINTWDRPPDMPCPFDSYLTNRCYQDLVRETTPPSLAADEKNVSHFGLTSRFPFLDHRLLRYCFSLPGTLKYNQGMTKNIMRRSMKGLLPEANRTNTVKTGFNAPLGDWLMGREKSLLWDLVHSRSFRERGWLKPGAIEDILQAHERGEANHMMFFWQLINAELWLRSISEAKCLEAA